MTRMSGRARLVRGIGKAALAVLAVLAVLLAAGFVFAGSADRVAAGVTVAGLQVAA